MAKKFSKEDANLLERLKSGAYDGRSDRHDAYNGGSPGGWEINNGTPVEYKIVSSKFFDGKENIRETRRSEDLFKSDKRKLRFLKLHGKNSAFSGCPEVKEAADAFWNAINKK